MTIDELLPFCVFYIYFSSGVTKLGELTFSISIHHSVHFFVWLQFYSVRNRSHFHSCVRIPCI